LSAILVVDHVMVRSPLRPDLRVLDVGTGTGAVDVGAAPLVPGGGIALSDVATEARPLSTERVSDALSFAGRLVALFVLRHDRFKGWISFQGPPAGIHAQKLRRDPSIEN